MTSPRRDARHTYNRMSGWYDAIAEPAEGKLRQAGLDLLSVGPGETVLEIGFGTGRAIIAIAAAVGEAGRVFGVDISDRMCERARAQARRAGVAQRVELRCADALELPYPSRAVDAVFASFTLELFDPPEIPIVLGECSRVLRSKGRLCTVTMALGTGKNPMSALYEWAQRRFPATIDCRPIRIEPFLHQAGFVVAHHEQRSVWGLPVSVVLSRKSS